METTEIKSLVETGLNQVKQDLQKAMEQYDGQLAEKAKVDTEVRNEVKELSEQFKSLNTQLTDLAQKSTEGFKALEEKSVVDAGTEFVNSAEFKSFVESKNRASSVRIELKNTVLSDNATTTWSQRRDGIIPGGFVPLTVRQVIPSMAVNTNLIEIQRENVWTSNAAEVAQAGAKPESDISFSKVNVPIETVAHWIKVSNQLLADAPAVASYINVRLADGLAQRIERQLILGNGTSPNLSGLTDTGNFVAYTPTAGDNLIDAVNRVKYTMWSQGYMPDTVIVNPADWGAMERTREDGATGAYLYGLPTTQAGMNPWGLQIVLSVHIPAGKFIVAGLRGGAMVYNRQGTTIESGYINADFTNNLVTIRAESRLALGVDNPNMIRYGDFTSA